MDNSDQLENPELLERDTWIGTLCGYFRDFLETDFKKSRAPKRSIARVDSTGLKVGFDISQYPTLREDIVSFLKTGVDLEAPSRFQLARGRYRSSIKKGLLTLIRGHLESISDQSIEEARFYIGELFSGVKPGKDIDPDQLAAELLDRIRNRILLIIINPLLEYLVSQLGDDLIGGMDSLQTVEEEIGSLITDTVEERILVAVTDLLLDRESSAPADIVDETTDISRIQERVVTYFENFTTKDAFEDLNNLTSTIKLKENFQLYLYLGAISVGEKKYPFAYIPVEVSLRSSTFQLELDPHIYINKKAVEFATGELNRQIQPRVAHTIAERIIYLNQGESVMRTVQSELDSFLHSLAFSVSVDISSSFRNKSSRGPVTVINGIDLAAFDQSDESLVNDYEELMSFMEGGEGQAFSALINSFMASDPISFDSEVDSEWSERALTERVIYDSPVPVNEEQQKILSALAKDGCKFVSVEGPPGTGKSHTITAIVFNAILREKNVLVLSDKKEALDVVEKKISSTIKAVRLDENIQDPILRLGKHGNTFNKIVSNRTIENLRNAQAASKNERKGLESEIARREEVVAESLKRKINAVESINLSDIEDFERNYASLDLEETDLDRAALDEDLLQALRNLDSLTTVCDEYQLTELFKTYGVQINTGNIKQFCRITKRLSVLSNGFEDLPAELRDFGYLPRENLGKLESLIKSYLETKSSIFGFLFKKSELLLLNAKLAEVTGHKHAFRGHKHLEGIIESFTYLKKLHHAVQDRDRLNEEEEQILDIAIKTVIDGNILDNEDIDFMEGGITELMELEREHRAALETTLLNQEENGDIDEIFQSCVEQPKVSQRLENILTLVKDQGLIRASFEAIPDIGFGDQMRELELLKTKQLTDVIDSSVVKFANEKRNTSQKIKDIIKKKQKFPLEEFESLKAAFPIIIAGIRDYAEYIPLGTDIFDVVIIDEASQVSIAQALPAFIRAKKVVVFGDKKQFANVKTSNASKEINQQYKFALNNKYVEEHGRANQSTNQLGLFDIKTSVLDFCDRLANLKITLKKHFRGYPELISLSSKYFYQNALQAVKVRGKPIAQVLEFTEVEHDGKIELQSNTNKCEVDYIQQLLKNYLEEGSCEDIMVITPHREQQSALAKRVNTSENFADYYEKLNLRIFTFDTCQGEEADVVIYSMVASEVADKLNYIFPKSLGDSEDLENNLRLQRLNVGFSRAKEKIHIVHSKPFEGFTGSIGQALVHYQGVFDRSLRAPEAAETDQSSEMEKYVLSWLIQTPIYEEYGEKFEIAPQFELGSYLRQLDPTYEHPKYRVDFLVTITLPKKTLNIIIEYDGFKEHFVSRDQVTESNYMNYMKSADVERQTNLESFGYKFIRINKFNKGKDPVATLDSRIRSIVELALADEILPEILQDIHKNEEKIASKASKLCKKCGLLKDKEDFYDPSLASKYGMICSECKISKRSQQYKPVDLNTTFSTTPGFGKRVYLNCPYSEKDECKRLGGRWDRHRKKWFIYEDQVSEKFKRWM